MKRTWENPSEKYESFPYNVNKDGCVKENGKKLYLSR